MMEILKAYEEAPEQYFGQCDEEYQDNGDRPAHDCCESWPLLLFLSTFQ